MNLKPLALPLFLRHRSSSIIGRPDRIFRIYQQKVLLTDELLECYDIASTYDNFMQSPETRCK